MTIPSLPTELWRLIIRSATSTGFELKGFIRETDLGWFSKFGELAKESRRTKIAITLVSRLFQQISSEFLHEHFIIDDLHSMRLADMLIESSSSGHGPCQTIKFIFVDAVYAAFRARMASQLVTILRLCCNLRGFSWIDCSKPHENNHSHDEKVIAHIPRNIQFFGWNARVPYSDLAKVAER